MGGSNSSESDYTHGFHVLNVPKNSPGAKAGLYSYFDYIIAANGVLLDNDDRLFVQILTENVGKEVILLVYNSKIDSVRETKIIPDNKWGGSGLIGVSIRFSSLKSANEFVWHVQEVYPDSPASAAGLVADTDYIIGTPNFFFNDPDDLYTLISSHIGRILPLYIYSSKTDQIRIVNITPNDDWGGDGSLGCDVCYGLIHRIPRREVADLEQSSQWLPEFSAGFVPGTTPRGPGGQGLVPLEELEESVKGIKLETLQQQLLDLQLQQQKLEAQLENSMLLPQQRLLLNESSPPSSTLAPSPTPTPTHPTPN